MSYILDALKRADAERERGAVPGLHAHQERRSRHAGETPPHGLWKLVIAVLLALLVLALALWFWSYSEGAVPHSPIQQSAPTPLAPPPPLVTTASVPLEAVPLPSRPSVRAVAAPVVPANPPMARASSVAVTVPDPVARPAIRASRETAPTTGLPSVTQASVPGDMPKFSDLPENFRQQIPPLNISGVVYAEATKEWILLVNDRLVTRGSSVTPDLRLEDVDASRAIFSFRGRRFRVDL